MKLVVSIVNQDDASSLVCALSQEGFTSTSIPSTGGFLHANNCTVLVGVDEEKVSSVINVVRSNCHRRTQVVPASNEPPFYPPVDMETVVGGATIFVVNTEQFERI